MQSCCATWRSTTVYTAYHRIPWTATTSSHLQLAPPCWTHQTLHRIVTTRHASRACPQSVRCDRKHNTRVARSPTSRARRAGVAPLRLPRGHCCLVKNVWIGPWSRYFLRCCACVCNSSGGPGLSGGAVILLYYTTVHDIILCYITLYHIALVYGILYCIIFYYILYYRSGWRLGERRGLGEGALMDRSLRCSMLGLAGPG